MCLPPGLNHLFGRKPKAGVAVGGFRSHWSGRKKDDKTSSLGPDAGLLYTADLCFLCTGEEFVDIFILTSVTRHIASAHIYAEKQISTRKRPLAQKLGGTDKLACTLLTANLFYAQLSCN